MRAQDVQRGDIIRITAQGKVSQVSHKPGGATWFEGGSNALLDGDLITRIELIDRGEPLPKLAGAVIRHAGCYLVLSTAGEWGCPDHGRVEGDELGKIRGEGFDVIFEGVPR